MLRLGDTGPEVEGLQRWLIGLGYSTGSTDGRFGPLTREAVRRWQEAAGLVADGVFGPLSAERAREQGWQPPAILWRPSRHHRRATRVPGAVHLVVVHCTQGPETPRRALVTAAWFDHPTSRVSAHYVVDPELIVQCVREADIAWHAGSVNDRSIGVELCGRAEQDAAGWADDHSSRELERAAGLVADICRRHAIPIVQLTANALRAGERGIVGHDVVSQVYGGTHWDPGPAFPWARWLEQVRMAVHDQECAQ